VAAMGVPPRLPAMARAFFSPDASVPGYLGARWLFLRALGVFYVSVFYSLACQIRGLIGDDGILPAQNLFAFVRAHHGFERYWLLPSLLWIAPNDAGLVALVVLGLSASLLLTCNVLPRASLAVCGALFLSFVNAAQVFSSYQSEGMLLEATAAAFILAPPGARPGLGERSPPSRAARFLVLWECFRIYFESGIAKLASGDPSWRDMTAMDHYYENGPLPTWIGWWAQQLPHGFHAATAVITLVAELVVAFGLFGPRRIRLATFSVLTLLQVGIIVTANYCFLNYLVLSLAFLCVDDDVIARVTRIRLPTPYASVPSRLRVRAATVWTSLLFYATASVFVFAGAPEPISWLGVPAELLAHLRLANRYGLFAVMTNVRYEIEFEGSTDGVRYVTYPFKYKPQALDSPPGIFAPYQPRFEWNLWFCAVAQEGVPRRYTVSAARATCPWVLGVEARLIDRSPFVLALFEDDPLHGQPPRSVRAVLWQYWMTTPETLRTTGHYWRRTRIGSYIDAVDGPAAE
jgi:hypothetical protein